MRPGRVTELIFLKLRGNLYLANARLEREGQMIKRCGWDGCDGLLVEEGIKVVCQSCGGVRENRKHAEVYLVDEVSRCMGALHEMRKTRRPENEVAYQQLLIKTRTLIEVACRIFPKSAEGLRQLQEMADQRSLELVSILEQDRQPPETIAECIAHLERRAATAFACV